MKRYSVADICGLEKGSNGRSCAVHPVCGTIVAAGDKLLLQAVVVDMIQANPKEQKKRMAGFIEEEVRIVKEPAIQAYLVRNGVKTCAVGFLPKSFTVLHSREELQDLRTYAMYYFQLRCQFSTDSSFQLKRKFSSGS